MPSGYVFGRASFRGCRSISLEVYYTLSSESVYAASHRIHHAYLRFSGASPFPQATLKSLPQLMGHSQPRDTPRKGAVRWGLPPDIRSSGTASLAQGNLDCGLRRRYDLTSDKQWRYHARPLLIQPACTQRGVGIKESKFASLDTKLCP